MFARYLAFTPLVLFAILPIKMFGKKQKTALAGAEAGGNKAGAVTPVAKLAILTTKQKVVRGAVLVPLVAIVVLAGIFLFDKLTDQSAYNNIVKKSNTYSANQQYILAVAAWQGYLKRWPPRAHDFDAYMQLGTYQQALGQTDAALASYLHAEKINPTATAELQAVAAVYEKKGDKAHALQYYQKLRNNYPKNDPVRAAQIAWLNNKIKQLEQK